ncbi:MAG: hypothetical protein OEW48_05390, partial [Phycisphaerae bacterium]|nr:hypothetical protein [Phycisphaerae bacterium]
VVSDYNNIEFDIIKKRHCDALYDTSTRGSAWEIFQLRGRSWIDKIPCCATKPQCRGTVEVSGKCYHASEVNYLLWGVMNKLCGNWWTTTKLAIFAHKLKEHGHFPLPSTIGWAKLGHKYGADWSSHPLPSSSWGHCDTKCGVTGVLPFTYKWDKDKGGGIDWW